MRGKHWRARLLAAALVLALGAAACGDDGGSSTASSGSGGTTGSGTSSSTGTSGSGSGSTGSSAPTTTGTPVKGGTITVGTYSNAVGLDPAKIAGGGTVGGMEHAALYDTIVRYNNVTGAYEPRTGAFTGNADSTVWTLKLKSGIKFADGTDYNADAVAFVVSREMKDGNSSPKGQLLQFLDADTTKSIKVVDPLTLQFTLKLAWADFPYMFANVQGWIYSPTQFAKVGDPVKFNADPGPAGAGPFTIKSYKPGEALELVKNPNYWGGDVYLDGITFKQLATPQAALDAIKTGTLQAAFMRDPSVIADAKKANLATLDMPTVAGSMININSATVPLKVRQAVAAAVDPKVVNDRTYNGNAAAGSAPFNNGPWDPKVAGPKFDVATAKSLLAEAKAAGFSGKIRLFADSALPAWGEAIRAQLAAVGFEVDLQTKPISEIVTAVLTNKDYDLTTWAYGTTDENPSNYVQLSGTFAAPAGRYGYSSPEMVAAIDKLRTAKTQDEVVAAYKAISDIWSRDVPAAVLAALPQALVSTPKLKGTVRTAGTNVLFDKAYLEK